MHEIVVNVMTCILCRYDLVTRCWEESPEKRPCFEDLIKEINILLENVAGYLEFSVFSVKI